MDWNVFWNAFGSIGTTVGSLITAVAVVIAVKQYKQPIEKKLIMKVSCCIVPFRPNCIAVDFYNKGMRKFTIESLYIKGRNGKLYLNLMQTLTEYTGKLPITVEIEERGKVLFAYDDFFVEISKYVKNGELRKRGKLIFIAEDSTGDEHVCKSKLRPH